MIVDINYKGNNLNTVLVLLKFDKQQTVRNSKKEHKLTLKINSNKM